MAKQFQVGKRYHHIVSHAEGLCVYVLKNGIGGIEWDSGASGFYPPGYFEIVPPKPRTGKGWLCVNKKDKCETICAGSAGLCKATWTGAGWDVFPLTWTEVVDQDETR